MLNTQPHNEREGCRICGNSTASTYDCGCQDGIRAEVPHPVPVSLPETAPDGPVTPSNSEHDTNPVPGNETRTGAENGDRAGE